MRRHCWFDEIYSEEQKKPGNWSPIDLTSLPKEKKEGYKKRKRALDLYLTSDLKVGEIVIKVGISRSELKRVSDRAFATMVDGNPVGYAACIPGFRVKKYERVNTSNHGSAGRFTQFLKNNPGIKIQLDQWALGKAKIGNTKVRGKKFKRLWKAFMCLCEKEGMNVKLDYPFNNSDGGREAVRRYCKKLRDKEITSGVIVEYGDDAGFLIENAAHNKHCYLKLTPYNRVQLDGHRIDTEAIILLEDAAGDQVELPLSHIWILALKDVSSRCILGYSVSLEVNYTMEDVLDCISNSFVPWEPMDLPTDRITYCPNAGLPSGIIEKCEWRAFDTIQFDNAYSHISQWIQERVIETGAFEVVSNRAKHSRGDSIIERFFGTFEELTFHEWPSTKGGNPKDPRRNNPDKEARRLQIEFEDIELACDVAIANFNARPHSSLNGRTPLEYIQYRIDRGQDLIRKIRSSDVNELPLFDRVYPVTIRGNLANGHLPYIQFKCVRYTNERLEISPELIGKKANFQTNIKDVSSGLLFGENGVCYGEVLPESRWRGTHSLRTRRQINKLVKNKTLQYDSSTPLQDFSSHLAEKAKIGRKERNQILKAQRELGESPYKTKNIDKNRKPSIERTIATQKNWISLGKTIVK